MPKFVPRERKNKVRARKKYSKSNGHDEDLDANALELPISTRSGKEKRRLSLRDKLRSQPNVEASQKQKRLEKYIDKKLQKEENLELIKKLEIQKVDTSLLRASTSLGVKKSPKPKFPEHAPENNDADTNLAFNGASSFREDGTESDLSDFSSQPMEDAIHDQKERGRSTMPKFGAGLKRPATSGDDDLPFMKKRLGNKAFTGPLRQDSESSWAGFSSSEDSQKNPCSPDAQTVVRTDSDEDSDISGPSKNSEDESSEEKLEDSEALQARTERSSVFKAWAKEQINEAMGFTPSTSVINFSNELKNIQKPQIIPRPLEMDPLPPELSSTSKFSDREVFTVKVERSAELHEARLGLPIVAEEQKIMEAIYNHSIVVIWGTTGSGKTTQVPQFLFEAGFGDKRSSNPGLIGITQPRRVAAVSMAKRVSEELGNPKGKVSYQIRFDSSVNDRTVVKFMTDGILLREISKDFSLSKYSVIIIDEAHERSTNTDILIGMVSRIVDLRDTMSQEDSKVEPLKLIIMSATLRVKDFLENPMLFRNGPPPLVQAEGRQYPVTTHFARRTQRDYVEEAFRKINKGHRKLPPGGMLVFLTGPNEIMVLSKKLKEAFSATCTGDNSHRQVHITAKDAPLEAEDIEYEGAVAESNGSEDFDGQDDSLFDDEEDKDFEIDDHVPSSFPAHILPLYSQLQTKDQLHVFQTPPNNSRLIVLATNIAETSLTIPGIRYVFDCGRVKSKVYDQITGVQTFEIGWISKASAQQRAGRAGRTGPGHCYRLYSSAVYERDFEEHAHPEILKTPVEGIVLQLKSMNIQHAVNFPFPTPPDRQGIARAEKLLTHLGAISTNGKISSLGLDLFQYPLSPRFAKIISIGHQHNCMPYTIALVAALATPNVFIPENQLNLSHEVQSEDDLYTNDDRLTDEARSKRKSAFNQTQHLLSIHSSASDALKLLTALCAYAHAADKATFCATMFLSLKALSEAESLFDQLVSIVHSVHPSLIPPRKSLAGLPSPTKIQVNALQQFVAAGFIDQVAILASEAPSGLPDLGRKARRATDVPYLPLFPITKNHNAEMDIKDMAIFIHPSSILANFPVKDLPTFIVYHHLQRPLPSTIGDSDVTKMKTRMHPLTAVTGRQLASLARGTALLEYGKPISMVEEMDKGRKRACWVIPSLVGEKKGGLGWPLPAVKVIEVKDSKGSGWQVESVVE